MSVAERLDTVAKRLLKKDQLWVELMKTGLKSHLTSSELRVSLKQKQSFYFILSRLNTRGASNKFLLEELALSLSTWPKDSQK
jgi:hypothetical protein